MAGLFDQWSDNPNSQAELAMISGLLAGKGNLNGILGRSMMGSQEAYTNASQLKAQEEARRQQLALQQQHMGMEREKLDMMKMPRPSEGFTMKPGEVRFDPTGKQVAAVPANEPGEKDAFLRMMSAAGVDPTSQQGKTLLQNYLTKQSTHQPAVSVSMMSPYAGVDSQGNPIVVQPSNRPGVAPQVLTDPSGKPIRPATENKPMTDTQANANLYATRMEKADKIIGELEGRYSRTGLAARQHAGEGMIGSVASSMLSSEGQKADQAQRDFINAVLRRESGAVISPSEFTNARQQYFPQPGDKPEVIKQKAANRATAIEGIRAAASSKAPVNKQQPEVIDFGSLK